MDFQSLQKKLGINNGALSDKLSISTNLLTSNVNDLITYCYQGQDIVIGNVKIISIDQDAGTISVSGTSDFLNVSNLSVDIHFVIDAKGEIQILLDYALLGSNPGVNDWKFSKSFPSMPMVCDGEQPAFYDRETGIVEQNDVFLLDELYFYNAHFMVTTAPQKNTTFNVELKWGINFVSHLRPDGFLGIIENLFQYKNELTVSGQIGLIKQNDSPKQLLSKYQGSHKRFQFPWTVEDQFPYGVPGILLQVDLDIDYSFVKDKIHFIGDKLYFYQPTDPEWLLTDTTPQFVPIHAYTGKVLLSGTNIEMDMIAPRELGMRSFTLISQFTGLSIENLSHLASINGGDSPLNHLPAQLQSLGDQLGKLSLTSAAITVDYENLTAIKIADFSFTIGMPDLNWVVWKDHFEIDSILCEFDIMNPFATKLVDSLDEVSVDDEVRHVTVGVYGQMKVENVPFDIYAEDNEGFLVSAEMKAKQTIPLTSILNKYVPGITPPSDLTIDIFRMEVAPGNFYSMALAMADKPNTWSIPIGSKHFEVYDVSMSTTYVQGGDVSGSISGNIAFGDEATLFVQYDTPGDIIIRSWLQEIKLKKMLQTVGGSSLPVPAAFDLDLHNNSLLIKDQGENFIFQLATELEGFGTIALQIQDVNNQSGVAFGINMTTGHPFDLPGLSGLKAFSKVVTLDKFLVIVSTFDLPGFQFPEIASFNNPALSSSSVPMPKGAGGVIAGLNIHATWSLDTEDKAQKVLKKILGLDPALDITLQVSEDPMENSRLYVSFVTLLNGHHELKAKFGFAMQEGTPEMFLEGTLDTTIQQKLCQFDVAMALLENGVYFSGSMEGTVAVEGVQLSNLALAFGFDWECIPSLGVAATIDTKEFDSSIAILFDSTDPKKSLFAGSISNLSLMDILEVFIKAVEKAEGKSSSEDVPAELQHIFDSIYLTGTEPFTIPMALSEALDNRQLDKISSAFQQYGKVTIPSDQESVLVVVNDKGKHWSLTDKVDDMRHYQLQLKDNQIVVSQEAQIYIAPEGAQMGKIVYPQGFFLTGTLSVLGLKWTSQVEVRKNKGIAASSSLNETLVIFNPEFFELADVTGKTGPSFSMSTFTQPELKDKGLQAPHFCLSGLIRLIGIENQTYIKATKSGMAFSITDSLSLSIPGKILSGSIDMGYTIHSAFDSIKNFDAGFDISLKLKGQINLGELHLFGKVNIDFGQISINLAVGGSVDMGYDGQEAFVKVNGNFNFQKIAHHFSLELDATNADIKKAGEWVLDELKKIFKEMFNTAAQWADAVKKGLISLEKGAEQMAHVFKEGFEIADKEAMKLVHEAGHDFKEIGNAFKNVYGSSEKEIGEFMDNVGAGATEVADTLKNTFKSGAEDVAKVLDGLEHTSPEALASAMKNTFKQSAQQVTQTMNAIGKDGDAIAQGLQKTFKKNAQQAIALLNDIGKNPEELGNALKNVYKQSAKSAAKTLHAIGKDSIAIGKALRSGFKHSAQQAAQVLSDIGIHTDEVSKSLKMVFGQSSGDMAKTLKVVGKGGHEIGSALKDIYKESAGDCGKILGDVNVGMGEITSVFKDTYKLNPANVAKTFKSLNKDSQAIADALKGTFKIQPKDIAKALDGAGFPVEDVGKALKNVCGQSAKEAAKTLKDIGKDSKAVASTLKNAFKVGSNETGDILKGTFNLSKNGLSSVMKGVGYSSHDVDKFMGSAFKSADKTVNKIGSSLKKVFHI